MQKSIVYETLTSKTDSFVSQLKMMPTSWHDDKREKKKKNEDNEEQKTMDRERSESATVDVNEILNQMTL